MFHVELYLFRLASRSTIEIIPYFFKIKCVLKNQGKAVTNSIIYENVFFARSLDPFKRILYISSPQKRGAQESQIKNELLFYTQNQDSRKISR